MASSDSVTETNESESTTVKVIDKDEFNNWLMNKVSRQSSMVSRAYGEKIIQYLRDSREKGGENSEIRSKYSAAFRFQVKKRKFQLINVVGLGDILCMPMKDKTKSSHDMLGQHRQVIFKEDMFDVIDIAHKNGEKHRGYKGTFKKISDTYCNIPREVIHKYVRMCQFCQKAHACYVPSTHKGTKKKISILRETSLKKKEIEMAFLTRCQIDILDMRNLPDAGGQFTYIGHFVDHHTKYNVLFPLKRNDGFYVAKKLCRYVFGHFGLPRILHSNLGRKYVDEVISWILQLWSTDAQILNGNPQLKSMNALIQQRQKTIMIFIETIRAKQPDNSGWSVRLPGIQYSLNTNQFEPVSPPAYDSVYNRRPRVCTYAPCNTEIPREEELYDVGDETPDTTSLNEVITVSMSELMQSTSDTILISPLNQNIGVLEQGKGVLDQRHLKDATVLSPELLNTSTLGSIPLTLGDQYTIIGSTLGVNGHTLQIPIVNLGNSALTITGHDETDEHSSVKTFNAIGNNDVKPSILSTAHENFANTLELSDENDTDSLRLTNHGVTDSLHLTNETVRNALELSTLTMHTNECEPKVELNNETCSNQSKQTDNDFTICNSHSKQTEDDYTLCNDQSKEADDDYTLCNHQTKQTDDGYSLHVSANSLLP